MTEISSVKARAPKMGLRLLVTLLATASLAAVPTPALAKKKAPRAPVAVQQAPTVMSEMQHWPDRDLLGVYAGRSYRPLWVAADGTVGPAATSLIGMIGSAAIDDVDAGRLGLDEARAAMDRLSRDTSPKAVAQVELALSRTLVAYVQAMTSAPASPMIYEHSSLKPGTQSRADILWSASSAASLPDYIAAQGWMHPLYTQLRTAALADGSIGNPTVRDNLMRLRALPATPQGKSIVVDAANARLMMFEDGRLVDTMKVVVGKADHATPLMAGYVRHAIVNPYWNIPDDMVQGKISSKVQTVGPGYLKASRFELLSGWGPDATLVSPASVDWKKVASGEVLQRVRQLPGGANAMGRVKFEFPNPQGIYLHDTPDKHLMLKDQRQFSSGCVRLEDAERLGKWLLGTPIPSDQPPETKVLLPKIVPIYITYVTARADNGRIAFSADPYKLDRSPRPALADKAAPRPAVK